MYQKLWKRPHVSKESFRDIAKFADVSWTQKVVSRDSYNFRIFGWGIIVPSFIMMKLGTIIPYQKIQKYMNLVTQPLGSADISKSCQNIFSLWNMCDRFSGWGAFLPSHLWVAPKKPILKRVKGYFMLLVDATKMYLGFNRASSSLWLSSFIIWKSYNVYISL